MKRSHNMIRGGGEHSRSPMRSSFGPRDRPSMSNFPRMRSQTLSPLCEQEVKLITNAYSLKTTRLSSVIHEYKFIVTATQGCKDIPVKALNRNYVSRSIRQLVMDEIVPKLVDTGSSSDSVVIDSNLDAIYSSKLFKTNGQELSEDSDFEFENLSVKTDQLLSRLHVDIVIKYSRSFSFGTPDQNPALLTSVLHHQLLLSMLRYGAVYYLSHDAEREGTLQESRLDLISQHIMGISLSGLRRSSSDQTLVVINCPHSYITREHRLIDLLATFITGRPVQGIQLIHSSSDDSRLNVRRIPEIEATDGTEAWFESFNSILTGFKCRADGPEEHINLRFSLTEESASDLTMIDTKTKKSLTVQEHYQQLGINLNYPNLPCLKSKSDHHPYYPLEMCSLLPDQKVPIFRLSTGARNHLQALNKPKPDMFKRASSRARDKLVAINSAQFETFGVQISKVPVEAKGSTLQKPTLQYQDLEIEPQRDFWESGVFYQAMHLMGNWCVVNTVYIDSHNENNFFLEFSYYCKRFGFALGKPYIIDKNKQDILDNRNGLDPLIKECQRITNGNLRFIMFVIDSSSTSLNRLIHLSFDEHTSVTATCLRVESIMNQRQQRAIFRTLVHKLNARLGGTNVTYHGRTLAKLSLGCEDLMIIGLDVTHPDNELSGVSIVGCAYTYSHDLFKHRSLVWPQTARVEIIGKMDILMERLLREYYVENKKRLPKQIIIYRDGVSHEEFEKVRIVEVSKAQSVIDETARETGQPKSNLSYIIAQKRHTMRFFQILSGNTISNPPSGTLIDQDVVSQSGREFYLYSNTSPQATARPLHYHVLVNGLGIENLQKLTYFLCFNFGKCSGTLSMPSSLKYAHNAAYDARNRVIAAKEFSENRFYPSKFFC